MERTGEQEAHLHSHRTGMVKAGNYYAGHQLTDRFRWGYNGSGPAQLALAISTDYFGVKPQGRALAKASYQPFQFTVIAARPECWKISLEEVGIALCRTLTDEPDLLNRVISSLESAVLDEIVRRLERNECGQRDISHEQGFEGQASGGRRCNRLVTPG
jgi:hypothetical protein